MEEGEEEGSSEGLAGREGAVQLGRRQECTKDKDNPEEEKTHLRERLLPGPQAEMHPPDLPVVGGEKEGMAT